MHFLRCYGVVDLVLAVKAHTAVVTVHVVSLLPHCCSWSLLRFFCLLSLCLGCVLAGVAAQVVSALAHGAQAATL